MTDQLSVGLSVGQHSVTGKREKEGEEEMMLVANEENR